MTYRSVVLADTPSNYWPLPSGFAPTIFDLGSAPTVAYYQGGLLMPPCVGPATGAYANTPGSAGTSNYRALDNIILGAAFSLEVWAWFAYLPAGAVKLLETNPGAGLDLSVGYDAAFHATFAGFAAAITDAAVLTTHAWHHLVGTSDPTTQVLYVDGVAVNVGANAGVSAIAGKPFIGRTNFPDIYAECALYTYALSAGQVAAHWAAADLKASLPTYPAASGAPDPDIAAILAAVTRTWAT